MNWEEGISLLGEVRQTGDKPGLKRIRELMHLLGDPQKELRYVHIAGTNGKGSAAAMLSEILVRSGFRTGRYISPHLIRINERFCVNGEEIRDEDFARYARMVRENAEKLPESPSLFERLTAVAFLYFRDRKCELVVLEVGLGGRFDATNVIDRSELSLIMHLGLEHTELLGNTIEEIAFEKAGIIKTGGSVVLQEQDEKAMDTIRKICAERGASLTVTSGKELVRKNTGLGSITIDYRDRKNLHPGLRGSFQAQNAAVVLDAVDLLVREKGFAIPEEAVLSGLTKAKWPGRFDVISSDPLVILDGAHNPDGCEALAQSLKEGLSGKELILVMGVMSDKNVSRMLDCIFDACREACPPIGIRCFIAVAVAGSRALSAKRLAEMAGERGVPTQTADSVRDGIGSARHLAKQSGENTVVLAFGSLYLAGEILAEE